MIEKIISGGQTGADRAALDFALAHGIAHGGWCPRGRLAEDGPIDSRYQLSETPAPDLLQRTEWNVRDSDATVIFSIGSTLHGGSQSTAAFAVAQHKRWLHVSREHDGLAAAKHLVAFMRMYAPMILNVAGPRASEEREVGEFVRSVLEEAWSEII